MNIEGYVRKVGEDILEIIKEVPPEIGIISVSMVLSSIMGAVIEGTGVEKNEFMETIFSHVKGNILLSINERERKYEH